MLILVGTLDSCLLFSHYFYFREHGVVGDMRDAWPNARVRKNVSLIRTYHGFKGDDLSSTLPLTSNGLNSLKPRNLDCVR